MNTSKEIALKHGFVPSQNELDHFFGYVYAIKYSAKNNESYYYVGFHKHRLGEKFDAYLGSGKDWNNFLNNAKKDLLNDCKKSEVKELGAKTNKDIQKKMKNNVQKIVLEWVCDENNARVAERKWILEFFDFINDDGDGDSHNRVNNLCLKDFAINTKSITTKSGNAIEEKTYKNILFNKRIELDFDFLRKKYLSDPENFSDPCRATSSECFSVIKKSSDSSHEDFCSSVCGSCYKTKRHDGSIRWEARVAVKNSDNVSFRIGGQGSTREEAMNNRFDNLVKRLASNSLTINISQTKRNRKIAQEKLPYVQKRHGKQYGKSYWFLRFIFVDNEGVKHNVTGNDEFYDKALEKLKNNLIKRGYEDYLGFVV